MAQSSSGTTMLAVLHHLSLPARLPGKETAGLDKIGTILTERLLDGARIITQLGTNPSITIWKGICKSLEICRDINREGRLNKNSLIHAFNNLEHDVVLILHVTAQNAAVTIRRLKQENFDGVLFEAFETSPQSDAVLSAAALRWNFPGFAVRLPLESFQDPKFQDELATFLETASTESIKRFAARSYSGRSNTYESRDTVDPALIIQVLMPLLAANGSKVAVPILQKRIRDDVSWDGAEMPWRRCPRWLVLRVALQRYLLSTVGVQLGRCQYKVCVTLTLLRFLKDALTSIPLEDLEQLITLKAKVCRRLVKIDNDEKSLPANIRADHQLIFNPLNSELRSMLNTVNSGIMNVWADHKAGSLRRIEKLPRFAGTAKVAGADPMQLTLPNSLGHLQQILRAASNRITTTTEYVNKALPRNFNPDDVITKPSKKIAEKLLKLSIEEERLQKELFSASKDCSGFADEIEKYIALVDKSYDDNPELKSSMLLLIMELWTCMDKCATRLYPLLKEYDPMFLPEIFEHLRFSQLEDMNRVRDVQKYLQARQDSCPPYAKTIFHDPGKGCFGECYYYESSEHATFATLHQEILDQAERRRIMKYREWCREMQIHRDLSNEVAAASCEDTRDRSQQQIHDRSQCNRCILANRLEDYNVEIRVHEHPLPADEFMARTVVFELACPKIFARYRKVTWMIISKFAYPRPVSGATPMVFLEDYSELRRHVAAGTTASSSQLSLASIRKSYLEAHWAYVKIPVEEKEIYKECRLNFGYFDPGLQVWPGRPPHIRPTFAHHCKLNVPRASPFHEFNSVLKNSSDITSYSIISTQSKCPQALNVHEFMAYQSLLASHSCRWLHVLAELGSSDLNFSSEATVQLIVHVTLQVGRVIEGDSYGAVHKVFRDPAFCSQLLQQLSSRMDAIASNWRENNCMEIIISLLLRLLSLGPSSRQAAVLLILKARAVTMNWINALEEESKNSRDIQSEQRFSLYALWAALLCRRTFSISVLNFEPLDAQSLACYLRCSITLQDNMPAEVKGVYLRATLMRDLKVVHRLRALLRKAIRCWPECVGAPLKDILQSQKEDYAETSSQLRFLAVEGREYWLEITGRVLGGTLHQTIHLHILEGHLLVMGEPLGKLPSTYSTSPLIKTLFKDQTLRTCVSYLPGMIYQISNTTGMNDHQVHVGPLSAGGVPIRALVNNSILQMVDPRHFRGSLGLDLPAPLVDHCIHWLNLRTGIIDIRHESHMWHREKYSHWQLNVRTLRAHRRPGQENEDTLLNPDCSLSKKIAQIFSDFEDPQHLTVYQPRRKPLVVHLQRLPLLFSVNIRGWLECSQLQAEINHDQDTGTWYGLRSKIMLTEVATDPSTHRSIEIINPQRKIIVSMGSLKFCRDGPHVAVTAINDGVYGIYSMNEVLGRLECGVEPRLLYRKALYHAYTSFPIPDELTQRTGREEAIHCLQSGYCQPWIPLRESQTEGLRIIASLTPRRVYYPVNLKVMQKTLWSSALTAHIQHDGYRMLVDTILEKSNNLREFYSAIEKLSPLQVAGDTHLTARAQSRRESHERAEIDLPQLYSVTDRIYHSRHFVNIPSSNQNLVSRVVSTIIKWPNELDIGFHPAESLEGHELIGGYVGTFESALLTDLLDIDLAVHWGSLVNLCCSFDRSDKYRLMFLAAVLAFSHTHENDQALLKVLLGFCFFDDLKLIKGHSRPHYPAYHNFKHNESPTLESMMQLIKPHLKPYPVDERSTRDFILSGKMIKRLQAAEKDFYDKQEVAAKHFVTSILAQWPAEHIPRIQDLPEPILESIEDTKATILPEWTRILQNLRHSQYLNQAHRLLAAHHRALSGQETSTMIDNIAEAATIILPRAYTSVIPTLKDLLSSVERFEGSPNPGITITAAAELVPSFSDLQVAGQLQDNPCQPTDSSSTRRYVEELQGIVDGLIGSESAVRMQYGKDLGESLKAFAEHIGHTQLHQNQLENLEFQQVILDSRSEMDQNMNWVRQIVADTSPSSAYWLKQGGLWPSITPITLLETLRSTCKTVLQQKMKSILVIYGLSITAVQRYLRMNDASRKGNLQKLAEEVSNLGHDNWQALTHPDWMLLEIDANILVRPVQVDVAMATISPETQLNSVLQMNMGQGKTSCIMPMAATVLADGTSLVRLIVPKALLVQTAQLMHLRLGGLLGREIIHVPFSRKTPATIDMLDKFDALHQSLKSSAGVVLALPEHLLSFQLSGQQQLSDDHILEAQRMMNMQKWFTRNCRDIIDEADSILAVRTQLIYPSGAQRTLDGHPHRWTIIETMLKQVESHLPLLKAEFADSIELRQRPDGGLPVISFLRNDVEERLISLLVDDVAHLRIPILPPDTPRASRELVRKFISEPAISKTFDEEMHDAFDDKPAVMQSIHLLRGLFIYRILIMTLKKRWNVQYGLHPGREPIAVPFTAKGTPSEQAEWGHPDVVILFTCLSFYYGGLTVAQLKQALEHVLRSDDPSQTYDRFGQNSTLPSSLRDWNAINVDDEVQLKDIWSHLRTASIVVDYFLNNYVFPKHAKQFSLKLQTSGWDIPLFDAEKVEPSGTLSLKFMTKQCLTTGFSGTNDWKRMLPLTISQNDLPSLWHTNAEVLTYLLQDRNRQCVRAQDYKGRALNENQLLHGVSSFKVQDAGGNDHKIRVLIDAGAQILEMSNLELVKAWLEIDTQALAAIYFGADNKAYVYNRRGQSVPFLASSFTDDLSQCLVYLDEAHTRGTDFKLPINAVGALTLGLGQTKDHTVQAAMRLRQLGTTQSVVFFAPPEVCHSIQDLFAKCNDDKLSSFDVVCWLLEQTCSGIEQLHPLYYAQGVDFCQRTQALLDYPNVDTDEYQRNAYLSSVRQVEQQTLQQLYGAKKKAKTHTIQSGMKKKITKYMIELQQRRKAFEDSGQAVHGSALQEVEQERETQYEIEAVREVQKPIHYDALKFPGLHRDLFSFTKTGRMTADSAAYELAFDALSRTALGKKYKIKSGPTSGKLFVSTEFTRTVRAAGLSLDHLQRPVKFLLWSAVNQVAIIIIPEEAEIILPLLQDNAASPVHLIVYQAPITRHMLHFDNFKFLAFPPLPSTWEAPVWLKIELGIYSGRLYFRYSEYNDLCAFLGIRHKIGPLGSNEIAHLDGIKDEDFDDCDEDVTESSSQRNVFTRKPLTFLQEWLAVRRKGQSFEQTPMGFVCQGRYLHPNHHFFANTLIEPPAEIPLTTVPAAAENEQVDVTEDVRDEEEHGGGDMLRPEDYIEEYVVGEEDEL